MSSETKDPLRCGKCGEIAQNREPSHDGNHWVWTHDLDSEDPMPKARVCVMKKEDYEG